MDPQVSTSFIPKAALTKQRSRGGGMGLFTLVSLLIFILSVAAAGGAYGYGKLAAQQLASKESQLKLDEGAFSPDTIQSLVRLNSRIEQAKVLLHKHIAPSGIFDFLADHTLVNVQFTSFTYQLNDDGSAAVTLDGVADSFSTVALQSDALSTPDVTNDLKDVVFSNINVGTDGHVTFSVSATVDSSLILYSTELGSSSSQTQQIQTQPTQAPPGAPATTTTQ